MITGQSQQLSRKGLFVMEEAFRQSVQMTFSSNPQTQGSGGGCPEIQRCPFAWEGVVLSDIYSRAERDKAIGNKKTSQWKTDSDENTENSFPSCVGLEPWDVLCGAS